MVWRLGGILESVADADAAQIEVVVSTAGSKSEKDALRRRQKALAGIIAGGQANNALMVCSAVRRLIEN